MSRNELIQACLRNDKESRHRLLEDRYGFLLGLSRRYTKNNAQAETFLHEALKNLFKHLPEYQDHEDLEEWIKKVVIKSLITQLKNIRTDYYITTTIRIDDKKEPLDLFHQAEEQCPNQLKAEEYVRVLQRMPASFRAIYNLIVIDKLSMQEAASFLEISEDSAKNSIERARFEFLKNIKLHQQGYHG
ncbi:MAG: sigma-70 family RNA polymerase sigma factor [Bacteroidetes bacterium]|nr:sigma-70 family RNA polymerase sigma factor [Bacteroidota bacterium]